MAKQGYKNLYIHFQDETRLGLITSCGRKITLKGVKPIGKKQFEHQAFYIYGSVCPQNGQSFFLELSHMDGDCTQLFLDEFALSHRKGLHILVWDGAPAHRAKQLRIPSNIILLGLPPASPELNPIERVWQKLKGILKWRYFGDLAALSERVANILNSWGPEQIQSLTAFPYLREAFNVLSHT